MGKLTLGKRKKRVRRVIVKDIANKPKPLAKKKKYKPTKKQLQKEENKRLLEEKKKRAAENIAKQAEIKLAKKMAVRKLNKTLSAEYPVWRDCLPLPIGIDQIIMEKYEGELSKKAMRELIGNHCRKRKYLENIIKGKRYDLFTGEVVEDVADSAIKRAQNLIDHFNRLAGNKPKTKSSTGNEGG